MRAPVLALSTPVIIAVDASIELRDGSRLLDAAGVAIRRGELIAVVGPSGAGKSTLLELLAGLRPPTSGRVEREDSVTLGYVPQEDIVHRELTVHSTVAHAARLRLRPSTPPLDVARAIRRTLHVLGLEEQHTSRVASLSGGQRKRVSIATELVVRPDVLLLDEPTAGLDPIAAAALMHTLRELASSGTAVVLSTHSVADLRVADRGIVVAPGGAIRFDGRPDMIGDDLEVPVAHHGAGPDRGTVVVEPARRPRTHHRIRPLRQVAVLARRNRELLVRSRMSLAIMIGSPLLVVAMFVTLFPADAFGGRGDRATAIAIVYWLAFSGFFFGLTFGLLQVCTELPIVRRERLTAVGLGPYLAAKIIVLVPVLGAVTGVMIAVLRLLDRLPSTGVGDTVRFWMLLLVDATAGLALGLFASAAVSSPAQAALALPMLCFPAVLFSGAIVPVARMAPLGRTIAVAMSDRWAFEALARSLRLGQVADPAHDAFGGRLTGPVAMHVLAMVAIAVICTVGARLMLQRRTAR